MHRHLAQLLERPRLRVWSEHWWVQFMVWEKLILVRNDVIYAIVKRQWVLHFVTFLCNVQSTRHPSGTNAIVLSIMIYGAATVLKTVW